MKSGAYISGQGSMNHVAMTVDEKNLKEYRERLVKAGYDPTPFLYHSMDGITLEQDESTVWISIYFFGPNGELLELAAQLRDLVPKDDIRHLPKTEDMLRQKRKK